MVIYKSIVIVLLLLILQNIKNARYCSNSENLANRTTPAAGEGKKKDSFLSLMPQVFDERLASLVVNGLCHFFFHIMTVNPTLLQVIQFTKNTAFNIRIQIV